VFGFFVWGGGGGGGGGAGGERHIITILYLAMFHFITLNIHQIL